MRQADDFVCDGDCTNCGRCTSTTASMVSTEVYTYPSHHLPWRILGPWYRVSGWFNWTFIVPVEKWLHCHGIRKCDWLD